MNLVNSNSSLTRTNFLSFLGSNLPHWITRTSVNLKMSKHTELIDASKSLMFTMTCVMYPHVLQRRSLPCFVLNFDILTIILSWFLKYWLKFKLNVLNKRLLKNKLITPKWPGDCERMIITIFFDLFVSISFQSIRTVEQSVLHCGDHKINHNALSLWSYRNHNALHFARKAMKVFLW